MVPAGRIGDIFDRRHTLLIGIAGVGIALSASALEVLRGAGISTSSGISAILLVLAGALFASALAVRVFNRGRNKSGAHPFG